MKILFTLFLLTSVTFAHHDKSKDNKHLSDIRIVTLTEKITKNPSPELYVQRGKIYLELGLKEKAKHDFEHALSLDENFQQAKEQLSKIK